MRKTILIMSVACFLVAFALLLDAGDAAIAEQEESMLADANRRWSWSAFYASKSEQNALIIREWKEGASEREALRVETKKKERRARVREMADAHKLALKEMEEMKQ